MSSITRSRTVTTLAELIHEQSERPWERSCRLAEDLFDALPSDQRDILRRMAGEPARVWTKQHLSDALTAPRVRFTDSRRVDTAAIRLRATIAGATGAKLVVNVWGVGYRLATHPQHSDAA
jgi:DNA-binding response OmpR family regulator